MANRHTDEDDDILINEDEVTPTPDEDEDDDTPVKGNNKVKGSKDADLDDDEDDYVPAKKGKKEHHVSSDDSVADDVEFGDEETMRNPNQLDKLVPEKGRFVRFSLLPFVKPKKALTHYVQGKGYAICNSTPEHKALCCKRLGDPDPRIACLVVQYTNASPKDAKLDPTRPLSWEIKFLALSPSGFRDISLLPSEDASPYDLDIAMTTRSQGKGYTYRRLRDKPTWRQNKELAADIEAECEKYKDGKTLTKKLGNKKTAPAMREFLGDVDDDDSTIEGM